MTIDEAMLLANVNERAQRLHQDGYRAQWLDEFVLEVINPGGRCYLVDTLLMSCDCGFFTEHQGRDPCKHLLGYDKLLDNQEQAREDMQRDQEHCLLHH